MRTTKAVIERVRWPGPDSLRAEAEPPGPTADVIARTFTYLYGAGGLLALATLFLPHGDDRWEAGIAGAAIAALAVAAATAAFPGRVSARWLRWLPLMGTVLGTVVMMSGDLGATVPYAGFYFWVVVSAFYLFDRAWAWFNVVAVAVAFAGALALSEGVRDRELAWVMVMGALSVGGAMIGLLRTRLEDVASQYQRALVRSRRSESALAEAQRIAQIGSWEVDPVARSFGGSAQFFAMTGIDPRAVTSLDDVLADLGDDDGRQIRAAARRAIEARGDFEVEHHVELPQLGRRLLHTRAKVVTTAGAAPKLVGTTQDVTEQRAQEAVLERTLRRLRATLEISLALARLRDTEGLIQLISAHAQTLLRAEAVYVDLGEDGPARDDGAVGALRTPLSYRGVTHGVLVALPRHDGPGFGPEDKEMLRAFAGSAAIAVAGAKTVQQDALRRSVEAAERERRRFARELHDQTLQGLAVVAMTLESALAEGSSGALEPAARTAMTQIRGEVENLRRIIADMRPGVLDNLGLAAALEELVERVRHDGGLHVDAEIAPLPEMDGMCEQTVYRVVQEALTNVVRHSGATSARVGVENTGDELVVCVGDDGRGFDPAAAAGFGLTGMRERLGLLRGTLAVESRPGATTLTARVPLAR